ncbi:MAG TPA: hypothetical protein VGB67_06310, partial [Fibrella sp.]
MGSEVSGFTGVKRAMGRRNVFQSLNDTFFDGGMANPKRRDYRPYADHDKTSEDILMFDKTTGKQIGQMRYKERIYDQKASKTIEDTVTTLHMNPTKEGYAWLGKFVADETKTHKDFRQNFAVGGAPEDPKVKAVKEIQQKMKDAGVYTGPIDGVLSASLKPAIEKWNALPTTKRDTRIVMGEDETGNLVDAEFRGSEETSVNTTSSAQITDGGMNASFVYEKEKKKPAPTTPARTNFMPETDTVGTLPAPPEAKVPAAKTPGTNWEPDRSTVVDAVTKPAGYNWLSMGNVADAARAFVGYQQASRPLPENPINADYLALVGEAKGRRNDGLGPATRKLYKDQIDDNRSLQIDAVRRATGGGGSAGAVMGGLTNINDATSTAALKLAAADEQASLINQSRYQQLLGGQVDMEQQRYAQTYNAGLLNRQAGMNLAQQGLQGIQDRYDVWNLYDRPGSPGQRYTQMQIDNANASN